jgi:ribosomal protein S18 acetylase RimI-like enzyme
MSGTITEVRIGTMDDLRTVSEFVDGMLSSWKDASSLQSDGTCCPDRTEQAVRTEINSALQEERLVTAWNGTSLSGFLVVSFGPTWMRQAELTLLNVHPSARAKGIGRALLGNALCVVAERGFRSAVYETWPTNTPVRKLFDSSGSVLASEQCGVVRYENRLPQVLRGLARTDLESVSAGDFNAGVERMDGLHNITLTYGTEKVETHVLA